MDKVAELLPTTVEEATKATPVSMLSKLVDPKRLEAFLAIELTKIQSLINVDQRLNLQSHQIPIIANHLITTFKNENLADFVICFRNGAMGKYDEKLLRLDGAIISQWMYKYLDEKYNALETILMRQKDNPYERPNPNDIPANSDEWFNRWKESIGFKDDRDKSNKTSNDFEIQKMKYVPPSPMEVLKKQLHLEWIRENYLPDGKPKEQFMMENEWLKAKGYFEIEGKIIEAETEEQAMEFFIERYA